MRGENYMGTYINHPWLEQFSGDAICAFPWRDDEYCTELTTLAHQLVGYGMISCDPVRAISLEYGPKTNASSPTSWTDRRPGWLWKPHRCLSIIFTRNKFPNRERHLTAGDLEKLIESDLSMKIAIKSVPSRTEFVLVWYKNILIRHEQNCITKENDKVAMLQALNEMLSTSVHERLESDLKISHCGLWKNFEVFMAHALRMSEALLLFENGPHQTGMERTK